MKAAGRLLDFWNNQVYKFYYLVPSTVHYHIFEYDYSKLQNHSRSYKAPFLSVKYPVHRVIIDRLRCYGINGAQGAPKNDHLWGIRLQSGLGL